VPCQSLIVHCRKSVISLFLCSREFHTYTSMERFGCSWLLYCDRDLHSNECAQWLIATHPLGHLVHIMWFQSIKLLRYSHAMHSIKSCQRASQIILHLEHLASSIIQYLYHLLTPSLDSAFSQYVLRACCYWMPRLNLVILHCVRDLIGNQSILWQQRLWHASVVLLTWCDIAMHPNSNQWSGSLQASYLEPMS